MDRRTRSNARRHDDAVTYDPSTMRDSHQSRRELRLVEADPVVICAGQERAASSRFNARERDAVHLIGRRMLPWNSTRRAIAQGTGVALNL
jgi:hypothetical protein